MLLYSWKNSISNISRRSLVPDGFLRKHNSSLQFYWKRKFIYLFRTRRFNGVLLNMRCVFMLISYSVFMIRCSSRPQFCKHSAVVFINCDLTYNFWKIFFVKATAYNSTFQYASRMLVQTSPSIISIQISRQDFDPVVLIWATKPELWTHIGSKLILLENLNKLSIFCEKRKGKRVTALEYRIRFLGWLWFGQKIQHFPPWRGKNWFELIKLSKVANLISCKSDFILKGKKNSFALENQTR